MKIRMWVVMLGIVWLVLPAVGVQGGTTFYRVVSSSNTVITAFIPDGFISWSNEVIGVTGSIQRATALTGGMPDWSDYAGFVAGSSVMVVPTPTTTDYMVVDLSGGTNAVSYPVSYMANIPIGGWSDEYKTTKMVFRRIPAGTFMMGAPTNELGYASTETQHQVTLTQPFYIGVFEVTQKQWERVMGTWPSYFTNASCRDTRPVEYVSDCQIRENINDYEDPAVDWPNNSTVNSNSFMGRMRAKTGKAFDLPTESQWEYAGRAGTTTALNSGKDLTSRFQCPNVAEVGRSWYNGPNTYGYTQSVDTFGGTAKVGSYLPNAWGLYDIHGNVREWCLDWYGTYPGTVSDPVGALTGSFRVTRGGSWFYGGDYHCRVGSRLTDVPGYNDSGLGFRVALPPGQ